MVESAPTVLGVDRVGPGGGAAARRGRASFWPTPSERQAEGGRWWV